MSEYSKRAQDLIDNPIFFVNRDIIDIKGNDNFFYLKNGVELLCNANFDSSSTISNIQYWTNVSGIDIAVIEAAFKILSKSGFERLYTISAREVESFLRDSNHISAIPEGTDVDWIFETFREVAYWQLKKVLLLESRENLSAEDSLISKIKKIKSYFSKFAENDTLFERNLNVELIELKDNRLVIGLSRENKALLEPLSDHLIKAFEEVFTKDLNEEIMISLFRD